MNIRKRCACTLLVATLGLGACGEEAATPSTPPRLAILSAFPAEMVPILAQAQVDHTVVVNDRLFRVGHLAGVPVVIGLTGIGLANATATTRAVLDQFDVDGVVVSAVANSTLRIGDVAVPDTWTFRNGTTFTAHQEWLDIATAIAAPTSAALERCTDLPQITPAPVCVEQAPRIVVGGIGRSSDPFSNTPFACDPHGDDLYGCDIPAPASEARRSIAPSDENPTAGDQGFSPDATTASVIDMETAAIAREAAARDLPFIAFRGVSDGNGDPLMLPGGALQQFTTYYRFAAHNAATATIAFLRRLAG